MNLLLCLLAVASPNIQAERHGDTLVFSLPSPGSGEKYTHVWVKPEPLSDPEWLSPNSFRIVGEGIEGTLSVAVCGPGYCRVDDFTWTSIDGAWAPPPPPDKTMPLALVAILAVVLVYGVYRTIRPAWDWGR